MRHAWQRSGGYADYFREEHEERYYCREREREREREETQGFAGQLNER
jgi:hypothetical protein